MTKRKRSTTRPIRAEPPAKKVKDGETNKNIVKHALLDQYYSESKTLRAYLVAKLPNTSHIRRKKIASIGVETPQGKCTEDETVLGRLLDNTIVSRRISETPKDQTDPDVRWQQWLAFSQQGDESYVTLSDGLAGSLYSQSEVRHKNACVLGEETHRL